MPELGGAVLAGGLSQSSISLNGVYHLDLANGRLRALGTVPNSFHDAAAATIAGRLVIFGGGSATSTDTVQAFVGHGSHHGQIIGHLPEPRSDLSAVTIGHRVYLLGGYTGAKQLADVLATRTGTSFATIARLPVTVRYAAVAAIGSTIWVFGGEHGRRPVRDIQRIDTTTGKAQVVGELPSARSGAAAFVVAGRVLIAGGRGPNGLAVSTVDELDPALSTVHTVAQLPSPIADTAAIVTGTKAYLIGGEDKAPVATVQTLTVRSVANRTVVPPPPTTTASNSSQALSDQHPFNGHLLMDLLAPGNTTTPTHPFTG